VQWTCSQRAHHTPRERGDNFRLMRNNADRDA